MKLLSSTRATSRFCRASQPTLKSSLLALTTLTGQSSARFRSMVRRNTKSRWSSLRAPARSTLTTSVTKRKLARVRSSRIQSFKRRSSAVYSSQTRTRALSILGRSTSIDFFTTKSLRPRTLMRDTWVASRWKRHHKTRYRRRSTTRIAKRTQFSRTTASHERWTLLTFLKSSSISTAGRS